MNAFVTGHLFILIMTLLFARSSVHVRFFPKIHLWWVISRPEFDAFRNYVPLFHSMVFSSQCYRLVLPLLLGCCFTAVIVAPSTSTQYKILFGQDVYYHLFYFF